MDHDKERELKLTAARMRRLIIEGTFNAKSGHPGGSMSCTEIIAALYFNTMKVDPQNPAWTDRDRFVLSKGHCAPALYAALALKGFFPQEDIQTLRKIDSYLEGHPNMNTVPGVDMSTGSLGQGISAAVGMALAGKIDKKDYTVYALLGDGEIQEGQVWEALMSAAHYKLDNMIIFLDLNGLQIDGSTKEVMSPYPVVDKFEAFGCYTQEIDGHDLNQIEEAIKNAKAQRGDGTTVVGKPSAIICRTVKGKGISFMENKAQWHGVAPKEEERDLAYEEIDAAIRQLL